LSLIEIKWYTHADDVNTSILGGSVHAIKKNTEALVVASREIGLEVNAEKTNYMVMSRDQNAGRNHNIKIDNKFIERVEQFKYLGATLTDRNSIQEEIKRRLKLENAFGAGSSVFQFPIQRYKD
jgi:hypothetical protein